MRGEHGFLKRIVGIFCGPAAPAGEVIQLHTVSPEQFLESTTVTGGVSRKQFGVSAFAGAVAGIVGWKAGHGRTLTTAATPGTSPGTAPGGILRCGVSRRRGR